MIVIGHVVRTGQVGLVRFLWQDRLHPMKDR